MSVTGKKKKEIVRWKKSKGREDRCGVGVVVVLKLPVWAQE